MKGKIHKNNNGENALRMRAGYFFIKKYKKGGKADNTA